MRAQVVGGEPSGASKVERSVNISGQHGLSQRMKLGAILRKLINIVALTPSQLPSYSTEIDLPAQIFAQCCVPLVHLSSTRAPHLESEEVVSQFLDTIISCKLYTAQNVGCDHITCINIRLGPHAVLQLSYKG
jgi:hypothetical protein